MTKKVLLIIIVGCLGIGYYAYSQQSNWSQEGKSAHSATLAELARNASPAGDVLRAQGLIVVSSRP